MAVWASYVYRDRRFVLLKPDDVVPAADIGAEFAGILFEQTLEPRLRQTRSPNRGLVELRKIEVEIAERHTGSPAAEAAGGFDSLQ